MGVFVLAAGIAVFSIKVWSTVNRRKKAKRALLLDGIIPGYVSLNEAHARFFTLLLEAKDNVLSDDLPPLPPDYPSANQKAEETFLEERIKNLELAVRHSDEFRYWEADGTEPSVAYLEQWLLEYQNQPFPSPPSETKKRQTLSLFHDISVYIIKTAVGLSPFSYHSRDKFFLTVVQIMRRLAGESSEEADRQILLQIYYQLKAEDAADAFCPIPQEKK